MKEYKVTVKMPVLAEVEVEVDSKDKAFQEAINLINEGAFCVEYFPLNIGEEVLQTIEEV